MIPGFSGLKCRIIERQKDVCMGASGGGPRTVAGTSPFNVGALIHKNICKKMAKAGIAERVRSRTEWIGRVEDQGTVSTSRAL